MTNIHIPQIILSPETSKETVIQHTRSLIHKLNLEIAEENITKPWGAYFRFKEDESLSKFIQTFYSDERIENRSNQKMSPKILVIAPHVRLSWQYHFRRSELWKVFAGNVGAMISETDNENEVETYSEGDLISVKQGQRHRLTGLDCWGFVAEIWQHTHSDNPSNEEDIVRVSDDFGR